MLLVLCNNGRIDSELGFNSKPFENVTLSYESMFPENAEGTLLQDELKMRSGRGIYTFRRRVYIPFGPGGARVVYILFGPLTI
jgi:hypothetical protein